MDIYGTLSHVYCNVINELQILDQYKELGEVKELEFLKDNYQKVLMNLEKCRRFIGDEKYLEVISER